MPGAKVGPQFIQWTNGHTGEQTALAQITADMTGKYEGWLRIKMFGGSDHWIILVPRARSFGGYQWYFVCPYMNEHVSVLWMPPGARNFAGREYWGATRVAYATQFDTRTGRAHKGQAKIKSRLIGHLDPDAWDLPPKPKWMRWQTYDRHVQKFNAYEAILDEGTLELIAKFLGRSEE